MRNVESISAIGRVLSVPKQLVTDLIVENVPSKEVLNSALTKKVSNYINQHVAIESHSTALISDNSHTHIPVSKQANLRSVVNIRQINDVRYINKYLCKVNECLPDAGLFIGCVESTSNKKIKLFKGKHNLWTQLVWLYCLYHS